MIVNRLFPDEVDDGYFGPWRERQMEHLGEIESGFAPVPVLRARYFADEVIGEDMLDRLGEELFADHEVAAMLLDRAGARVLRGDGRRDDARISVPFTDRSEVSLKQVGSELIVAAGGEKRTLILPPALARRRSSGAKLRDGALEVTFPGSEMSAARPRPAASLPTSSAVTRLSASASSSARSAGQPMSCAPAPPTTAGRLARGTARSPAHDEGGDRPLRRAAGRGAKPEPGPRVEDIPIE